MLEKRLKAVQEAASFDQRQGGDVQEELVLHIQHRCRQPQQVVCRYFKQNGQAAEHVEVGLCGAGFLVRVGRAVDMQHFGYLLLCPAVLLAQGPQLPSQHVPASLRPVWLAW